MIPIDARMNPAFVEDILKFLDRLSPTYVTLTSSFRTYGENVEVGGVDDSDHLKGLAVDLVMPKQPYWKIFYSGVTLPLKVIYDKRKHYYHIEHHPFFRFLEYDGKNYKEVVFQKEILLPLIIGGIILYLWIFD